HVKSILSALRIRPYHFGVNLYDDIKVYLPNLQVRTVFDVGANEGQSARTFRQQYPESEIYCFEPNAECCRALESLNLDLRVYPFALGNRSGDIFLDRSNQISVMYFVTDRET